MNVRFRSFFPFISRSELKEVDGRYQYAIRYNELVLCICYQPPHLTHLHYNRGPGAASDAVYVIKGEYRSKLVPYKNNSSEILAYNSLINSKKLAPEDFDIVVKEKEFKLLDHRAGISNMDTAGDEGAFMIHFNPLYELKGARYNFISNSKTLNITPTTREMLLTLETGVLVNGVELPLMCRAYLLPDTPYSIVTSGEGRAVSIIPG